MKLKFFYLIFALIGTPFLLIGLSVGYANYRFKQNAVVTEGIVIDLIRSGKNGSAPVVRYQTFDGATRMYQSSTFTSPSAYKMNEQVKVYYDPENPDEAALDGITDQWLFPLGFSLLGAIFSAVGWSGFFVYWQRDRKNEELMYRGKSIQAMYLNVRQDYSFQVNNRSPFVIRARYEHPQTKEVHIFESEHIWFDPSPYITNPNITVKVDPFDIDVYWMDTRFLPKKG